MAQQMGTATRWCGRYRSWAVAGLVAVLAGCGSERPAATPAEVEPPAAVAEAAPVPPPAEAPVAAGRCDLPPANAANLNCWKSEPELLEALETAMTAATLANPENYDFDSLRCGNCYYVKDHEAFYAEVARQLDLQGVCSEQGGDEITLKSSNGWSEQFDIMLASGHMRRSLSAYLYSCTPAMF